MTKAFITLASLLCIFSLFACGLPKQPIIENTSKENIDQVTEVPTDDATILETIENTTNTITDSYHESETTASHTTQTADSYSEESTEEIHTNEETTENLTVKEESSNEISTEDLTTNGKTTEEEITEVITELVTTKEETTEEVTTEEETVEDKTTPHVEIEASKTQLAPGEEFSITVSIKNNPGIYAFAFSLPVNETVFEFVSATTTDSVCKSFGICKYDTSVSTYKFNGFSSSPFNNVTDDGKIVTITLKVNSNASAGKYTLQINLDNKNIINVDSALVSFRGSSKTFDVLH